MPNPQDIFQLAQQTATQVTASPENWRRFLYTAAHNYHTTYLNQLLIHAQRPDATACATMKYWNEQAHRKVMYGSKSIIILQRHQGVPTAKRVFSMTDTVLTGDKAAAPWEVTDAIRPLLMQVNSVGSLMDRATEQVVSLSDRANRVLATSIEDSALNWSHPEDQRFILQEVAAQSTLYMICIRLGIPVQEEDFPAFQNVTQFDTSRISLCLGGYVQAAAEPLLDELGHEVMQLARDSVAIQAEPVHNTDTQSPTQTTSREEAVTDDVHEREGLSDSEPELAESQENQPEPVRQDAAGLLGTERAEPVRPDDAGGNAAAELPQDGAGRTAYVINEEQAATVRRIFNLYAEGHGETTVAKMLIEENRKDGGGGLSWTASKVSRVLRKPTYKGYMTYNKSHIDDFLSHNRINHSEEDFVLVKGNFEPIVSEALWETCNQIRSKRAAFVKGKDGRAHKFGVSFPQNKWTKILFCDCGMRFQIEGYDKTANGGKNMRLICARSKMFKKKDAARALNGIPCPAPYASEWKLELMAREVFRTVWKENAEDILGLLRMLDANLNTTGTPNDGNQLENKLSALNEELDDLVSQRASRSITMDDFLSRSTEINNEIINVEGLLQSSIQEQRPKARLDMHSIEAALSDDASFPDGKIEPGFLDRYANRIVKSNNRYIWMLQLVNVQQIMPIQSERQPIAMVTYKSGVPYDIEQEQTGKQDKESAGPDCATICRPQDFFLNMSRTKRKRKLVEWLESCQENQVNVLDEKIPLLSFAVDFVTAYEYQKARGIKIHPGLWKDMRVDIFLVKKEN